MRGWMKKATNWVILVLFGLAAVVMVAIAVVGSAYWREQRAAGALAPGTGTSIPAGYTPNGQALAHEAATASAARPTANATALVFTPTLTSTLTLTPTLTFTATSRPSATPTLAPSATVAFTAVLFVPPACVKDGDAVTSPIDGMTLLCVTKGDFRMGSDPAADKNAVTDELPMHSVTLKAFWIDQTEVTNRQYALCVRAGACTPPVSEQAGDPVYFGDAKYDNYPVTYVDWGQAAAYCAWATRRLPSEAEWEKAARGTKGALYPWGNAAPNNDLLNYKLAKSGPMPVGSYPKGKSPYGALDMAGNVMEWVQDWYKNDYYKSQGSWLDPTGPAAGTYGITKGGAWISHADYRVRAAARYGYNRKTRLGANGFRCAVEARG